MLVSLFAKAFPELSRLRVLRIHVYTRRFLRVVTPGQGFDFSVAVAVENSGCLLVQYFVPSVFRCYDTIAPFGGNGSGKIGQPAGANYLAPQHHTRATTSLIRLWHPFVLAVFTDVLSSSREEFCRVVHLFQLHLCDKYTQQPT